ncbi:hypothetical protein [Oceanimonas smirnovii]|uniref:hypothetical protein n=1 Tax=Oceanimonas smirnovii TaxID=264574 RepID=UPI00035FD91B|nr:hypothetical protein [Oceanimonas smirnovii]
MTPPTNTEPRSSTEIIISALHIIARDLEFTESAAVCEAAGRLEELDQQVRQLQGDNKALKEQNQYLRQRPDLPVDRIPAYKAHAARITELEESNERWRKIYQAEVIKAQECEELRREWEELAAHAIELKSALKVCIDVFRRYEQLLSAKPDPIKADGHAKIAEQAEQAINATPATSLAEVRAQAIEQFAEQWDFERGGDGEFAVFACKYADRIRKEAQ